MCPLENETGTHSCPMYFYSSVKSSLEHKLGSDLCFSVSSSYSVSSFALFIQQLLFFITGSWQRNCNKLANSRKHLSKTSKQTNQSLNFFLWLYSLNQWRHLVTLKTILDIAVHNLSFVEFCVKAFVISFHTIIHQWNVKMLAVVPYFFGTTADSQNAVFLQCYY